MPKPVTELKLTDGGDYIYVSLWRKPADMNFEMNQLVTIHDISGRRNTYRKEITMNGNFLDEVHVSYLDI